MLITMLAGTATAALATEPNVDATGRDRNRSVSLTINHQLSPTRQPIPGQEWELIEVRVPAGTTWDGSMDAIQEAWLVVPAAATGTTATTGPNIGQVTLRPANQGVFIARHVGGSDAANLAPDFLVSLPYQRYPSGEWIYDVTAYPKMTDVPPGGNKILTGVALENVDEGYAWRMSWLFDALQIGRGAENILCANIGNCGCYMCDDCDNGIIAGRCECECDPDGCCDAFIRFIDEMDERLTLDADSIEVFFVNATGAEVELTRGGTNPHWRLVEYSGARHGFEVQITRAGIAFMYTQGTPGYLSVAFDTIAEPIPCDECDYFDITCADCIAETLGRLENEGEFQFGRLGFGPRHRENNNYEYFFNIELTKVSTANTNAQGDPLRLPGATFRLFPESQMTGQAGDANRVPVNREAGYIREVVTGANGLAIFQFVHSGVWYVYEFEAPTGYIRHPHGIRVELVAGGFVVDGSPTRVFIYELEVDNSPGFELPMTGGTGTILLTIIGALLLTGATIFFVASKRRRRV